jgi:hypothetical protein
MNARHAVRRTGQALGWVSLWLIITLVIGYIFAGPTDRLLLLWPISLAAIWFWHRAEVASIRRGNAAEREGWKSALALKDEHMKWQRGQIDYWSERATGYQTDMYAERLKVRKIVDLIHNNYMDELRSSWAPELGRSGKDLGRYLWERVHRIEQGIPPEVEAELEQAPEAEVVAQDGAAVTVPEG